jgi:uncharacterized protein YkwD
MKIVENGKLKVESYTPVSKVGTMSSGSGQIRHSQFAIRNLKGWLVSVCIALLALSNNIASVQASDSFPDVSAEYQFSQSIQVLKDRKIVQGFPDGTFGPNRLITRAELLKIALEGAGVATADFAQKNSPFPDLSSGHSLRQYVIYAQEKSIVGGYPDGTYRPDDPTSRGEAIKMLLNINNVTTASGAAFTWQYQDVDNEDPLARFVYAARDQKVIPNKYKVNTLGIGDKITRGEVAEMMYRLLTLREQRLTQFPEVTQDIAVVAGAYPTTTFTGITLQATLPKTMVAHTYYAINATTTASMVKLLLQNEAGKQWLWEYKPDQGKVRFDLQFPDAGTYKVAIIADNVTKAASVPVAVRSNWNEVLTDPLPAVTSPQFVAAETNLTTLSWTGEKQNAVVKLICEQGAKSVERFIVSPDQKWQLDYQIFAGFVEGSINCRLAQSQFNSSFSLTKQWSPSTNWSFDAIEHHFRTWIKSNISVDTLPLFTKANQITFTGKASIPLSNFAAVINPDGSVKVFPLGEPESQTFASNKPWSLPVDLSRDGVYFLEINDTQGIAVLNTPIYKVTGIPVLPDFVDMQSGLVIEQKSTITAQQKQAMMQDLVTRINAVRAGQGKNPVTLDSDLSRFAQAHADDMVAQDYFSHRDRAGKGPDERKLPFNILQPVGENIAFSVDIPDVDAGLRRSAVHLLNILDSRWSRVGIGLARAKDGLLYAVEEFSTRSFIANPFTDIEKEQLAQRTLDRINVNRQSAGLSPLLRGTEFRAAMLNWATAPRSTNLRTALLDAGLGQGRLLSSEGDYSANLPAELALQAAVSETSITKMDMAVTFEGEKMLVAVLLY